jgi:hypothetical protein
VTKERLIRTAGEIPPASSEAVAEYERNRDRLVAEVNRRMETRPDLEGLVGRENLDMMRDNHANHGRFVRTILKDFDPEVLVETVLWVFRAYRSRGFSDSYWAAQLNEWMAAMNAILSTESAAQIQPLYDWFIVHIPAFTFLSRETPAAECGSP